MNPAAMSRVAGVILLAAVTIGVSAARPAAQAGPPPPQSPRDGALIDITGQWVSVITEDWRWRMVTPPKGDTASVPLNAAGRKAAGSWDLAADTARGDQCKAFGPPSLIRQPGRIRIRWEDAATLLLEFDAGRQVRRFRFGSRAASVRSLQGQSQARWFRQPQNRGIFGRGGRPAGGSLEVETVDLLPGYLRANGVPYSERTTVKEFFDTFTLPDGGTWLIVTSVVNDPQYLTQEFVLSSQFKKESDTSKWNPRPCAIPPPLVAGR